MSAAPQIHSLAELRSSHGFTIVRLGSSQAAKKYPTPPSSSNTTVASPTSGSPNVQPILTPILTDSLPKEASDAAVLQRREGSTSGRVSTPSQSPPKSPVTSTPPDLDAHDTVCLIGSDCYKPSYIPMMFYDEA